MQIRFDVKEPAHMALRSAYEAGASSANASSSRYALYADKRNLVTLSDDSEPTAMGVPAAVRALLASAIPHTKSMTPERAEALWVGRRKLFFKPAAGYGSKAAYRGDKFVRRVWSEIVRGDYVA